MSGKPVLFVSGLGKSIDRSENLHVLFDAYKGEKKFMSTHDQDYEAEVKSGKYDLMVIDIFPTITPGKTIMIWHAIQGGKYIGLDDPSTYYREHYADLMDCIVVAGYGGIEMFNRCTKVPKERIIDLGMPRTDRYKRVRKGDGHTVMADKRGYLFAPTFRNFSDTPFPCIDWKQIDNALTDDEIMVVKPHPYGFDFDIDGYRHIVAASKMDPSVNYLFDADVVITDYSSIMFDAYLLKKPVVLFEKSPGYTKTRGMYLHYPEHYCSRFATDEKQLVELMKSAKHLRSAEKHCLEYVADACDGHSCERICELITEMNRGGERER